MRVSDIMTRDVYVVNPVETIGKVAQIMAGMDVGALPVGDDTRLLGMITDRDIAVRGIAKGFGPDALVNEIMTEDVKYCYDDQDLAEVTRNMGDIQLRRLPVVDRNRRLVGILSLGDIATGTQANSAAEALSGISRPGGSHNQES
jgi:CBS domain-containing protein